MAVIAEKCPEIEVTIVDINPQRIAAWNDSDLNKLPVYEPGLAELVGSNVKAGRLDFTTDLTAPVAEADAVFIAVGTPSRRGDGHADLSYVYAAAREIAALTAGPIVVVTKSTVPVGTGDEIEQEAEIMQTEQSQSEDFLLIHKVPHVCAEDGADWRFHPCPRLR